MILPSRTKYLFLLYEDKRTNPKKFLKNFPGAKRGISGNEYRLLLLLLQLLFKVILKLLLHLQINA
jgi:hypothetical protein